MIRKKQSLSNRRQKKRQGRGLSIETLEARVVLAADLVINELMAVNDSSFADEDGAFSDWIEIFNTTDQAIDLNGWNLTDDDTDLAKWTFPAQEIGPGEFLVVFASDKDRTLAGSELHTNFKLTSAGEYLAIVDPSGTVSHEYNPEFPAQFPGISYGLVQPIDRAQLVADGATAQLHLPTDNSLGTDWTQIGFDDSAWQSAPTGIGFDSDDGLLDPLVATDIEGQMLGTTASAYARFPFQVDAFAEYDNLFLDVNYDDGFVAYLNGTEVARANAPDPALGTSTATAEHGGVLDSVSFDNFSDTSGINFLSAAGQSGDRLRLTNNGGSLAGAAWLKDTVSFGPQYSFSSSMAIELSLPGGSSDTDGPGADGMTFVIQAAGTTAIGGAGGALGLSGIAGPWVAVEFDTWTGGSFDPDTSSPTHVGIDSSVAGFVARTTVDRFNDGGVHHAWIDYDGLTGEMNVFFSSGAVKPAAPTVTANLDLADIFGGVSDLTLGWTAGTGGAINRHEVLSFDFVSGAGDLGLITERIDLSDQIGLLQEGDNVLAIHGLNVSAADQDFLLRASLEAIAIGEVTPDTTDFLADPTPGLPNGLGASRVADMPRILVASGTFVESMNVEITAAPGAEIRYTTDGSDPDERSTLYNGPFTITSTTFLKAKAFRNDALPSVAATTTYIALDSSIGARDSNVPLVIIDTLGGAVPGSGSTRMVPLLTAIIDTDSATDRASITGNADFVGWGGMRVRGSSSAGWPKQNFAFELRDEFGEDLAAKVLGFSPESDWVLYASYIDRSFVNDRLTFELSNQLGQWAPKTRAIELYVNRTGGQVTANDYLGLYIFIEKIKRDPGRLDLAELSPTDNSEPEVTGGYILKHDRPDPGGVSFPTRLSGDLDLVDPEEEITPQQLAWITGHFRKFEDALLGPDYQDDEIGYEKYIDVDSWVDHWILTEFAFEIDGYRLSSYLYKDRGEKIHYGPVWDFDRAYGDTTAFGGNTPTGWYATQVSGTNYPWWPRLFSDPDFEQAVVDRWHELRKDILTEENIFSIIDGFVDEVDEAQERNFAPRNQGGAGHSITNVPVSPRTFNTFEGHVDSKKAWIAARLQWIDDQFIDAPTIDPQGGENPAGFTVTLEAPAGTIYYTLDGTDPRAGNDFVVDQTTYLQDGADATAFVPADNSLGLSWTDAAFDDASWKSGTTGIAYDNNTNYDPFTGLDITAEMQNINQTVYIRVPFQFDGDVNDFDFVNLMMRYDDGFVAYLNGDLVASANADLNNLTWDSASSANHDDAAASVFTEFDITNFKNSLVQGENILAIHGLNFLLSSSDFLMSAEIVAGKSTGGDGNFSASAIEYVGPITIDENTRIFSRVFQPGGSNNPFDSAWSGQTTGIFVVAPVELAVTELHFNPTPPTLSEANAVAAALGIPASRVDSDMFEFIEIKNTSSDPISLKNVRFSDGIDFTFSAGTLQAGEHVLVVANQTAFEARYGNGQNVAGEYTGQLRNSGEHVTLLGPVGESIMDFSYNDDWYSLTDGEGFSLSIVDATASAETWNNMSSWRPSDRLNGSPGSDDLGLAPLPGSIVFNEILANTTDADGDKIELHNTSSAPIDLSNFWLSDDLLNLSKYQLPSLAPIPAGGFLVLNQQDHFGGTFALPEIGGDLILQAASADGEFLGFRTSEDYRASDPETTQGRYLVEDGGSVLVDDFTLLTSGTLGAENAGPVLSPIVFNEIMYHPADQPGALSESFEFIELKNVSDQEISLDGWSLGDGVLFTFPDISLPAGGMVVIAGNLDAFNSLYTVPNGVPVLGPYTGRLDNNGEDVELFRPGAGENPILSERINYDDESPWPTTPDGFGQSLSRVDGSTYGNNPANWSAGIPGGTPGSQNIMFDETPPTIPTGLVVSLLNGPVIDLVWEASTDSQTGVNEYVVYRNEIEIARTMDTSFSDTSAISAVDYGYTVTAVNGSSVESDPSLIAAVRILDVVGADPINDTRFRVQLSEAVSAASANDPANYSLSIDTITIIAASLDPGGDSVLLTASDTLVQGQPHRVLVSGLSGTSGGELMPGANAIFTPGVVNGGVSAKYFNNKNLSGDPVLERVDTSINFNWGTNSPDPSVNADNFSARWTGSITPQFAENYLFRVLADDDARLWINDVLLFDGIANSGEDRGTIDLSAFAGKKVPFVLEYFESTSRARMQLAWQPEGSNLTIIPSSAYSTSVEVEQNPPTITGLQVRGSSWSPEFLTELESLEYGAGGIDIPLAAPFPILPWAGIDEITVTFDEDVKVETSDLIVPGHTVVGVVYDFNTYTATWTLGESVLAEQVSIQLGAGLTDLAGNTTAGGPFVTQFKVLSGDVDRDGIVNIADLRDVMAHQFSRVGEARYSVVHDLNGDGVNNFMDLITARDAQNAVLAAPSPLAPQLHDAALDSVLSIESIEESNLSDQSNVVARTTRDESARLAKANVDTVLADLGSDTPATNGLRNLSRSLRSRSRLAAAVRVARTLETDL